MDYLLGLDIGTTHLKAGLFTVEGKQFSVEMVQTKTHHLGEGRAVYDPLELWESVACLIRRLTGRLGTGDRILSVAVASMGEAGLFLDRAGVPLTPIIAWFDSRGKETIEDWTERFGGERTFSITGLNPNYIHSLPKILWLMKHEPEVVKKASKWLCMTDFVAYRLSGEYATDYSIASRTMLFDVRQRRWSEEILDFVGLDEELFPATYPGGTAFGEVGTVVAQETGLRPGTPVVTGGHDHICGAFAVGAFYPGRLLDSSGTAESVVAAFKELPALVGDDFRGFNVGCHVAGNAYYIQGGINASGLSIEWFKSEFAKKEELEAETSGKNIYDVLSDEARKSPAGAGGVTFIPHLRGAGPPNRNAHNRSAFLGLRDYHQRRDFIRAILEGLAFEFDLTIHAMEEVLGINVSKVSVIGGGSKNKLWMEIKSAVSGKVIEIPAVGESTLLGAALLGGIGAGVYRDADEAIARSYETAQVYQPDPELTRLYKPMSLAYRKIVPLVCEISHLIRQARL